VVGAGPAGLEAARVAARAGHDVYLYERDEGPGGQFNLAAVPPGKQELCKITRYLSLQAGKAGAKIVYNTPVTPELLAREKPDALVIATGARACRPAMPGAGGTNVLTAHEVLAGNADIGPGKVLIIGGGMVGCELASFIASVGDNITIGRTEVVIAEMTDTVAADMFSEGRELLMEKLRHKEVRIITSATVKEITADGAVVALPCGDETITGMDYIIFAAGAEPVNDLSEAAAGVAEVHVIGDAREPRQVLDAIREGSEIGRVL
jgi:7beta-hydroxy-3-oxochol-24-oyl-CoA 4-desaturase